MQYPKTEGTNKTAANFAGDRAGDWAGDEPSNVTCKSMHAWCRIVSKHAAYNVLVTASMKYITTDVIDQSILSSCKGVAKFQGYQSGACMT